ncbi:MAG: D-alanyl-D-alanine carboxypeptidase [Clostridiales bacterium]|nr:D-alanyl-D-alanine carboxypeptidase [Clostridiales bacterium]
MKKLKISLIVLLALSFLMPSISLGAPPDNSATAAVLMEVETGRVLYEKNPHDKMPMASTTKIMTTIIALENSHPSDIVTVAPEASGVEGSSLYLAPGEKLTMEQLLYGLMLRSGNDSAMAIAMHLGKSQEGFAQMMNKKAKEIGARNTNFMNPHGLHHDEHYTTAYDLALISAYAMKNSTFREIVSTKYYKIPWEGHPWDRVLMNKNALLWDFEGANGIKTGYTKASGRCLASASKREDMQLVAIVLRCQPWFEDSAAMLEYGFENFHMEELFSQGEQVAEATVKRGFKKKVGLILEDDITLPLSQGELRNITIALDHPESITAPIVAGTRVGSIEISLGDKLSISKDIFTAADIKENTIVSNLKTLLRQWMINSWSTLPR